MKIDLTKEEVEWLLDALHEIKRKDREKNRTDLLEKDRKIFHKINKQYKEQQG